MKRRYLTFEERGVLVGFRARRLALVRCRPARNGDRMFEALLPNWAGLGGTSNDMVLPFPDLPGWGKIEGYDRALFDRVVDSVDRFAGRIDPIMMRELRLETDTEIGDPAQAATARFELAIGERDANRALLEMIAMFGRHVAERVQRDPLHHVSGDVLFHLADRSPEELQQLVRLIARAMARNTKLTGEVLRERLDRIAEFAAPISSLVAEDPEGVVGFLTRQFRMVQVLHETLKEWGERQVQGWRLEAEVVCSNVAAFLTYAYSRSEVIRKQILEDRRYTEELGHQELLQNIAQERVRIAFAMDGWSSHAATWAKSLRLDFDAQLLALASILRDMPKAPGELEDELNRIGRSAQIFRGRTVRELHGWSTDQLDVELHSRVNAAREAMAGKRP